MTVDEPLPGVTEPGLTLQVANDGAPLQLRSTGLEILPPSELTLNRYVAVSPGLTEALVFVIEKPKSLPDPMSATV
jgi:hypothetical protein